MNKIIYLLLSLSVVACSSKTGSPIDPNDPDDPSPHKDAGTDPGDDGSANGDGGTEPDGAPKPVSHCGDKGLPKCKLGVDCRTSEDCDSEACNYAGKCIAVKSCINHFGGDTCGKGEVGQPGAANEDCCRTLPVKGFTDGAHPSKVVYLDKYEITAGRVRTFIADISKQYSGKPNVKSWVVDNKPDIWNNSWNVYLPTDFEMGKVTIPRLFLGDPRHDGQSQAEAGPGVILPPPNDQTVSVGLNAQFGAQVYADVHGNNCGLFAGAYGFPTYYYPAAILSRNNEVPRVNALDDAGKPIPAQDWLDVKSMNCITNAMLQAFCAWDGGQLATNEVMEYVTAAPANRPEDVAGCGTQYDNHGSLLGNDLSGTVRDGGRCPSVAVINASFDAGDNLPVPGSFLNVHNYHYPDLGSSTSDKSWQIEAPGRLLVDAIRINTSDEPWMDLAGNLTEAVLVTKGGSFTGRFGLRQRGIGYGSARSDLNVQIMPGESILRVQRPEVKSALVGARCMRFK